MPHTGQRSRHSLWSNPWRSHQIIGNLHDWALDWHAILFGYMLTFGFYTPDDQSLKRVLAGTLGGYFEEWFA